MSFDPYTDLWRYFRGAAVLDNVLDQFVDGLGVGKAVFKFETPAKYKFSEEPALIIDRFTEGPTSFGSFSTRNPTIFLPVRLISDTSRIGDQRLSAAAMTVRDFLHAETLPMETGQVIDLEASLPEEAPTTSDHLSGLRILLTMLIEEG